MSLKDKITSKEQLIKVFRESGGGSFEYRAEALKVNTGIEPAWWAVREHARLKEGIYQTTEALDFVNKHSRAFAHISELDKTKVAFTPDKAFGERDAQLVINFGKLVQRVIPFASDEYVKQLTESHAADLSDEVEWVTGPQIANVYATTAVASCMVGKSWTGANPLLAYDAPGIKMAVLRDSAGNINARCMVYETDTEKRMIRNYGDGRLQKRLMRLGYVLGGWQGVKFRTIMEPTGYPNRFNVRVPYLDSMGGTSTVNHCTLMLMDGVLQGVQSEKKIALSGAGVTMVSPGTSGYVTLTNHDSSQFTKIDCITGKPFNTLEQTSVKCYHNGELGTTTAESLMGRDWVVASMLDAGRFVSVHMNRSLVFEQSYSFYLDRDHERRFLGFVKLSPKYYDSTDWYGKATVLVIDEDSQEHHVLREHTVMVYDGTQRKRIHKTELSKKFVRVADESGEKWYVTPEVEVLRTPSKAKVVRGIHDINEGWQGWDYSRNLQVRKDVLGETVRARKADEKLPAFKAYVKKLAADKLGAIVADLSQTGYASVQDWFVHLGVIHLPHRYYYPKDSNVSFKRSISGLSPVRRMDLQTFKEFLNCFAETVVDDPVKEVLLSYALISIAEMEATNGEEPVTQSVQTQVTEEPPKVVIKDQDQRFALAA